MRAPSIPISIVNKSVTVKQRIKTANCPFPNLVRLKQN